MSEIKGYRQLMSTEVDAVNRIKAEGERLERLLDDIGQINGVDGRWLAIAKTNLQQGFMAAVRAITKPETFA